MSGRTMLHMGAIGLALSLVSIVLINFYEVNLSDISSRLAGTWKSSDSESPARTVTDENSETKTDDTLFTADELSLFNGRSGLYLAILGQVFNVEKGAKHYTSGSAYHSFTGRDASRAFVTGDFSPEGLRDDVLDLRPDSLIGLEKWLHTYHENYDYMGKLIGRYYTDVGQPTDYNKQVEAALVDAWRDKKLKENEMVKFPPCNSAWTEEIGSRVWCTKLSGGIKRDWEGVPRQLYNPDTSKPKCVCARPEDLEDPNLKPYDGCPKDSVSYFGVVGSENGILSVVVQVNGRQLLV